MTGVDRRPGDYGDLHAGVYDRIYGARFAPDQAVAVLADATGPAGRLLEMGVGTGRLAIPLAALEISVDGIEASSAMIARLRSQPNGQRIEVFQVDLADFDLPRRDYDVAVCAVSTLFMLPRAAQRSCIAAVARHLKPEGRLFVEVFRPDPDRYDRQGMRVETRPDPGGGTHVVRSHHDPAQCRIHITHELSDRDGTGRYDVTLNYLTDDELDQLAFLAGLELAARWHDWTATSATVLSTDPVSVYTPSRRDLPGRSGNKRQEVWGRSSGRRSIR